MNSKLLSLPFDGEYRHSPSKKYKEVVVFVHHFGGHKKSTKRHQEVVLEAGYDCVTFNLYYNSFEGPVMFSTRLKMMLKHLLLGRKNFIYQWTEELNCILDRIEGEKILFTLSSPSASVLGCIGHKRRTDIKAWICDCGPFLDAWSCFWNYNTYQSGLKSFPTLLLFNTLGFLMFGGVGYDARTKRWILRFPKNFPVLSLRAAKDLLVPPSAIRKLFNISNNLEVSTHLFVNSGHLEAVKTEPEEYKKVVLTFLQKNTSSLESSS